MGSRVGLRMTSKRIYVKGPFQDCCCLCPHLHGKPLPTQTSTRSPSTWAGRSGSVFCGVTVPFTWVLVCTIFCLCHPRVESLYPPVLWKSCNQIPLAFKVRFLISNPFAGSLGWKAWHEAQNLYNSGRTSLVLSFSRLWVAYLVGMGSILLCLQPSYHLVVASFLSLDIFFFFLLVGSNVLLSMIVQQLVFSLFLSQEEMSTHTSTPPAWL